MYHHLENVSFHDGSSDNFPEGPYDVAYSNFVLLWVKDKKTAFEGIHHNLKNEGLFGISTLFGMAPITQELIDLIGPDKAHELWRMLVDCV